MIIRCIHLREIGLIKHPCCPDCHGPAGGVGRTLPGSHQAIHCCARTDPFSSAEMEALLANVPRWEAMLRNATYHKRLRLEYQKARTRLRSVEELMRDAGIAPENENKAEA